MATTVHWVWIGNGRVGAIVGVADKIVPKGNQAALAEAATQRRVFVVHLRVMVLVNEKEKVKLEGWTSVRNTHMFPVLCPSRSHGSEMNSWWKTYPGVYHCHLDTLANDSLVPQLVHLGHHVR